MTDFPRKAFTVASTGHTYEYIRIKATSPDKPTIAFFHGFPDIAFSWRHQITHVAQQGCGVLAPDLLGFGGSSTPEDAREYRSKKLVEDLMAVLDHEEIDKYHGVGHDAGTYVLSRLHNYHPARLLSMTFISIPYGAPGVRFDINAMNAWTKNVIGFEKFAYMQFLASERSPGLIEQHLESFQSLAYHSNVTTKADNFYPPGKLEAWLKSNRNDNSILLDATESAAWLSAFRASGLYGATNGYRVLEQNLNEEEEKADLAAGKITTKINVPVLAIDAAPDKASIPGFMEGPMKAYVEGELVFKVVQSQGHYPHIVSKEEVNEAIEKFIAGVRS